MRLQWFYTKEGICGFLIANITSFIIMLVWGFMYEPKIPLNITEIYNHGLWNTTIITIIFWIGLSSNTTNTNNHRVNIIDWKQISVVVVLMIILTIHPLFLLPKDDITTPYKYYDVYFYLFLLIIYVLGYFKLKNQYSLNT